jgi:predicted Zn-dependent protease
MADTTTAKQIAAMQKLTLSAGAWLCGVQPQTLKNKVDILPPSEDGSYDAQQLMAGMIEHVRAALLEKIGDEDAAKAKLAVEKARIAELKRMEMEGGLINVEAFRDQITEIMSHLRASGEALQRLFGEDAADIFRSALNDCLRAVDNITPDGRLGFAPVDSEGILAEEA